MIIKLLKAVIITARKKLRDINKWTDETTKNEPPIFSKGLKDGARRGVKNIYVFFTWLMVIAVIFLMFFLAHKMLSIDLY